MAIPESADANIIDVEAVNWRMIVYPVVLAIVLLLGGFGYYYYQLEQRNETEAQARDLLIEAKTPEQFAKVADQFPHTDQAALALLSSAQTSFDQKAYPDAIKSYQRVIDAADIDTTLSDSAQIGLAAAQEASGKIEDAIKTYLVVARRGKDSPYAPFAYDVAARLYEQKGDKENERLTLISLAGLGTDSPFVKQAGQKLKTLESQPALAPVSAAPISTPAPAPAAPAANAAPPPVAPAPDKK
jgi:predicted negative regulator of RcsB-dependent stress response